MVILKVMDNWIVVIQIAQIVLGLISGVGAVSLIDMIKNQLHLSGRLASLVTVAVVVVLAILNLIVTEQLTPVPLTAESIVGVFAMIYTASQAEYLRLRKQGA